MAYLILPGERIMDISNLAWLGKIFSHTEYPPPPDGLEADDLPTEAATENEPISQQSPPEPQGIPVYKVVAVFNNPWSWGSGLPAQVQSIAEASEPPIEEEEPAHNEKLENKLMRRLIQVMNYPKIHFHANNLLDPVFLYAGSESQCSDVVNGIVAQLQQHRQYVTVDGS